MAQKTPSWQGNSRPLLTVSLRSTRAHLGRMVLSILAVVLGTAFVSGSFMFTASLNKTFEGVVDSVYEQIDLVVRASSENTDNAGKGGVPIELADALRGQPGVTSVDLSDAQEVVVGSPNEQGQYERTFNSPAGSEVHPHSPGPAPGPVLTIEQGHEAGHGELLLPDEAARAAGLAPGSDVVLVNSLGRYPYKLAGTYSADVNSGGRVVVMLNTESFIRDFTNGTHVKSVQVNTDMGGSEEAQQRLREQIAAAGFDTTTLEVVTGKTVGDEFNSQITKALSFVNYFLVAFGLIALLVGTFIIANTFAMIVAQRLREFALLRSLGTSQWQISRSVIAEGFLIAILGSTLGVLAGVGLVKIILAVMDALGAGFPEGGVTLTPASVIVPFALGLIVTVIAAWEPAQRAGRAHPVEVMRSTATTARRSIVMRTVVGLALVAPGLAAVLTAGFGSFGVGEWTTRNQAILCGAGATLLIVGVFALAPALSLPIVPTIGRVIGLPFGAVAKLASTNVRRNPQRTAVTAFALTLGVALVTTVGMLGASMKANVDDQMATAVTADYVLSAPPGPPTPLPLTLADDVRRVAGMEPAQPQIQNRAIGEAPAPSAMPEGLTVKAGSVVGLGIFPAVEGRTAPAPTPGGFPGAGSFIGVADGDLSSVLEMGEITGSTDLGARGGFIAEADYARDKGWSVGDRVPFTAVGRPTQDIELIGTFSDANLQGSKVFLSQAAMVQLNPIASGFMRTSVMVKAPEGASKEEVQALGTALQDATASYLIVQVVTPSEFAGQAGDAIDQMLNILYALLALAVIVAILGIVNTLALSVIERRQEVGMLRAVGMQRAQIRRMISLEAVQIAVFGALLGVVLGLVIGWSFISVLSTQGLSIIKVPWPTVLSMLLGSGFVGVAAAVIPARKAARTSPLEAIAD